MTSPFQPVNEDHAVALCEFALGFDGAFNGSTIDALAESHQAFEERLPAAATGPFEVAQAIVPTIKGNTRNAVTFATLRADGTHVWSLEAGYNELRASCTRYTRWARSWDFARELFETALPTISSRQPDRRVSTIALYVVDQFFTTEKTYNTADIIRPNGWVGDSVFKKGGLVWHSNNGWFDSHSLGPLLNILNVRVSREGGRFALTVVHHQQLRIDEGKRLSVNKLDTFVTELNSAMMDLHENNKATVTELLHADLAKRVGLGGPS